MNTIAMLKSTPTLKQQVQVQLHFYHCCYYDQFPGVIFFKIKIFKLVARIPCPLLKSNFHSRFKNSQTWSLYWTNLIMPTASYPTFVYCNVDIFPFNLDHSRCCFTSCPSKKLYSFLIYSISATCVVHHMIRDLNTITELHTLWSSSF
jgi:hypothetical protein